VNSLFSYRTPYELHVVKRYPGASIAVFDTNALLTDIYKHPTQYLDSPANVTGQYLMCDETGSNCQTQEGKKGSQFLWYDELHPTERVDEVVAREFVRVVEGSSRFAAYW
jgi:phospholipase/lecithinase/hemolysin